MIGIGGWRQRDETAGPHWHFKNGTLVQDKHPGPAGAHGNRLPFQIVTRVPHHPIMKGIPQRWMHASDELYNTLRGPAQNMTVLATAYSDPANNGTGRDEPIIDGAALRQGSHISHDTWPRSLCTQLRRLPRYASAWYRVGRYRQGDAKGADNLSDA
jgi:hypothetical protein